MADETIYTATLENADGTQRRLVFTAANIDTAQTIVNQEIRRQECRILRREGIPDPTEARAAADHQLYTIKSPPQPYIPNT